MLSLTGAVVVTTAHVSGFRHCYGSSLAGGGTQLLNNMLVIRENSATAACLQAAQLQPRKTSAAQKSSAADAVITVVLGKHTVIVQYCIVYILAEHHVKISLSGLKLATSVLGEAVALVTGKVEVENCLSSHLQYSSAGNCHPQTPSSQLHYKRILLLIYISNEPAITGRPFCTAKTA